MTIKAGQISSDSSLLGKRDAFHVPSILVRCNDRISPSCNVCFCDSSLTTVKVCSQSQRQAIVDPFIEDVIEIGELFWVFIIPDLVDNLVHHFELKNLVAEVEETIENDDDECKGCYEVSDEDGCRHCY